MAVFTVMHLFTYGSLMFPEVWNRVVQGTYHAQPARLAGYRRGIVLGETYPGILSERGREVAGTLYCGVHARDLAALDAFEGSDYRRVTVEVELKSGTRLEAESYLYLFPGKLSDLPWSPETFELARFLARYCQD